MRFFIAASFFGIVCAIIIGLGGQELWFSRWHPATLALTHALVIGVFSIVMCGALLQLISVLGGQSITHVRLISTITLAGLSSGTIALVSGFMTGQPWLIGSAFIFIVSSISLLLFALLVSIGHTSKQQHSLKAIRLAIASVLLVLLIASLLVSDHFLSGSFNQTKQLTNSHAGLGLVGWVSLLIMGVSFQVLPMFYVAQPFPHWAQRQLPLVLFSALIIRALLSLITDNFSVLNTIDTVIKLSLVVYALVAAKVIYTRKRKIPDIAITFWYIALSSLILCMLLSFSSLAPSLLLATLFCAGWVLSIILAMLIKIAPFLAYIHLQRQCGCNFKAFELLPNMHQLLSKTNVKVLFFCHCTSLALLTITQLYKPAYLILSASVAIEFCYLAGILFSVSRQYKKVSKEIAQLDVDIPVVEINK